MKENKYESDAIIAVALKLLDVFCRKGCREPEKAWEGFENGGGQDCGIKIERLIKRMKRFLKKSNKKKKTK